MTERYRLYRDTFIRRGLEQNALERKMLGLPAQLQTDPEQAWVALYGNRKWVYLELDKTPIYFGGDAQIVGDEVGNGPYPGPRQH